MKLTNTDLVALENNDSEYILNSGIFEELENNIEDSKEYYILAACMGNSSAINKLGKCYLEEDSDLALAYFKLAARKNDPSALYNLGHIYNYGKCVKKDIELANYYYKKAMQIVDSDDNLRYDYPNLYYEVAQILIDSKDDENLDLAFDFLTTAKIGFATQLPESEKELIEVTDLLNDSMFDEVRNLYETDEEDDDCCCGHCH